MRKLTRQSVAASSISGARVALLSTAALCLLAAGCESGKDLSVPTLNSHTARLDSCGSREIFSHVATAANINAHYTVLDHKLINGDANARLIVTPTLNPAGAKSAPYHNHVIGVFYLDGLGRWAIFNQHAAAMPVGAAFNVRIGAAFVHQATLSNTEGASTYIQSSLTDGKPELKLLITANWNPGGGASGVNQWGPIGVGYNPSTSRWTIINQYLTQLPLGASFNVDIDSCATVHRASTTITGNYTELDDPRANGNPDAQVVISAHANPDAEAAWLLRGINMGVLYNSATSRWAIFNQDGEPMAPHSGFNVVVQTP